MSDKTKTAESIKYAEKIIEVAYYNLPLVHPKETVLKCVDALIQEFADASVKAKTEELEEIRNFYQAENAHLNQKVADMESQLSSKTNNY